jgi:hypothetical protein
MSISITEVRNAVSIQANNLRMDVEINHPDYGWIPYTIDSTDTDATIENDDLIALIGTDFAAYSPPSSEEVAIQVRRDRDDILIQEVDPFVSNALRWADLTSSKQTEWATYRTALLDIPEQSGFPNTISWPTAPE